MKQPMTLCTPSNHINWIYVLSIFQKFIQLIWLLGVYKVIGCFIYRIYILTTSMSVFTDEFSEINKYQRGKKMWSSLLGLAESIYYSTN